VENATRSGESLRSVAHQKQLAGGHLLDRIETEVAAEIKQAVTFALAAPYPDADEVDQHVYA